MDFVIVTAWRRPEFLWASLTSILAAVDRQDAHILVSLDRHYSPETKWVAEQFAARIPVGNMTIVTRMDHQTRYRGNSFNVIESYRDALAAGPSLVHLIEDDVFVGYDYFDFHRRAHALVPDAFSVSACRNQQFPLGTEPPAEDDAVYSHASYQSIGVSFRPEVLASALDGVGHDYYTSMVAWCQRRFPNSSIPAGHAEQDGLLNKTREFLGAETVYGAVPRAYHAGFMGYHRNGSRLAGTISYMGRALLEMNGDELNKHAHDYKDHSTIDLDADRASASRTIVWP
jgi:hypothetical protein